MAESNQVLTVYLDECGYTGPDLLDKAQPVFVLASIAFSDSECVSLKKEFFAPAKAAELKHANLGRRPNGRKMVLEFLTYLSKHPSQVRLAYAYKPYALVCKMVDIIVETAMSKDGLDAYKNGSNISLANELFYCLPTAIGRPAFEEALQLFQSMIRNPCTDTYNAFHKLVFNVKCEPSLKSVLDWLKVGHLKLGPSLLDGVSADLLDISNAFAYGLATSWATELSAPIAIIHDASAPLAKNSLFWEAMTNPAIRPTEAGYDRRKIEFPLRIVEVKNAESKEHAGLQLADVLAGASVRALMHVMAEEDAVDDEYAARVYEIISKSLPATSMWPELKFTPEELGTTGKDGQSLVDFTVETLAKHLGIQAE